MVGKPRETHGLLVCFEHYTNTPTCTARLELRCMVAGFFHAHLQGFYMDATDK
jgi:hypothetical protein